MAGFIITAEVYDESDSLVDNRKWINEINEKNLTGESTPLFHIGYLSLAPGKYKIKSTLTDIISEKQRILNSVVDVPDFFNDKSLKVSDLELAYRISSAAEKNPFVKNGLMVVPNPTRTFTVGKNLLYVYFEIINLEYDKDSPGSFKVIYQIEDNMGNVVKTYDQTVQKPGDSAILYRRINIAVLKPGLYSLVIKVNDEQSSGYSSSYREFEVFRPQTRTPAASGEGVTSLTEEQAEMYGNLIEAVGTSDEVKIYKSLGAADKVTFIQSFWRKRDPDPDTPENEFRAEMLRRWNYVKKFSRPKFPGWRTYFGKVYLELGEPDHIEELPDPGLCPHQIWRFYQARITIVFADLHQTGVYRIINEERPDGKGIYNENWKEQLRVDRAGIR